MIATGHELADEGAGRALRHAEAEHPGWGLRARDALEKSCVTFTTFTSETVRAVAKHMGLEDPPDDRSWGGVFRYAVRKGWMVKDGYETSANAKAHARPVTRWKSKLYHAERLKNFMEG